MSPLSYRAGHSKTDKGCPACAAAKHKSVAIVSPMSGLNFIDEFEELRYVYKLMTLGPGKYIRLIELSSGGNNDPILCQKYYAYLDDNPTYEAITYTWADEHGDYTLSKLIICFQKLLHMTLGTTFSLCKG
jgi:hypothetical protein